MLQLRNYAKKFLVMSLLLIGMSACGGGVGNVDDNGDQVSVDGINLNTTIDKPYAYDLTVDGVHDHVTIAANNTVSTLTISGTDNDVTISADTTVNSIDIDGVRNTLYLPVGYNPSITQSGSDNSVVHQ